jgi:YCII-related domain-containing protein
MAKFVLLYEGGSMPETDAEREQAMKAWEGWFGTLGSAVKDQGNPFAPASKRIKADGSITTGAGATSGYSIIEADSLDTATDLAKGCPVLAGGASVGVYEIFPVM